MEIGESYERDKFKWTERTGFDEEKRKKLEFGFKMNHIKQVVRIIDSLIFSDQSGDNW